MASAEYTDGELPLLRLLPLVQRLVSLAEIRKHYGLTRSQIIILIALYYRETLTMSRIAEYLASSKEQATRAVAGMVEHGLAERMESAENRTRVYVCLTETGRDYVEQCRAELRKQLGEKVNAALTPEEKVQLHASLETAVTLLSKIQDGGNE